MTSTAGPRFYPFDKLIIGFCTLMAAAILLLGRPLGSYLDSLAFFAGVVIVVILVARCLDPAAGRWHALVRLLYPVLLFSFFYTNMGNLVFLMHDQFYDWQLTAFEQMILGVNPTLYIDKNLLNVWINDLFSLTYASYYPMIPVFFIVLFLNRREGAIKRSMTAVCTAFFISYILFVLYPIEGPRWYFASEYNNGIEGLIFRPFVEFIIDTAAFRGGCMPSSHVAVAIVIMLACLKYYRRVGWALVPVNIGLAIGTFWGRFHYISDVVVGLAIGIFSWRLIETYYSKWTPADSPVGKERELQRDYVT
ncbi:MAG: phosphatase PAP2 family protein [Candidatus Zixiibacteriota bacterium]|nr:MAG: phosphatase PAP2 family protein [candidate division Zixibacteria bacterium]